MTDKSDLEAVDRERVEIIKGLAKDVERLAELTRRLLAKSGEPKP